MDRIRMDAVRARWRKVRQERIKINSSCVRPGGERIKPNFSTAAATFLIIKYIFARGGVIFGSRRPERGRERARAGCKMNEW